MKKHVAPFIAGVLLLLPVLYVGSYLALVVPEGIECGVSTPAGLDYGWKHYRWGDARAERVFWPLEQIDRRVRPGAWEPDDDLPFFTTSHHLRKKARP
jgi:hypothetical protein